MTLLLYQLCTLYHLYHTFWSLLEQRHWVYDCWRWWRAVYGDWIEYMGADQGDISMLCLFPVIVIISIKYIILIITFHIRCVVTSCTHWWEAGVRMEGSMPLITAKSSREMLASWARMKFSLFCLTSLQGFCSSFTLIDLKASIFPSYRQIEVILMFTEHFWMIRYKAMSYSEH